MSKLIAAAMLMTCAVGSSAIADTRYVSKGGSDSGTCGSSSATPCLTIGQAITNANSADPTGFLRILINSNGGFQEPVTLTRSSEITVVQGYSALIVAPSAGTAITVNAGVNDSVRLYNVYLAGSSGAGATAIDFTSGNRLELHNSQIRGFSTLGIAFRPSGGTNADLLIENSDIGDSNGNCVLLQPNGMQAAAYITNTRIHHCSSLGIRSDSQFSTGFVRTLISKTQVFSVGQTAVSSFSGSGGGTARVTIEDSDVSNSNSGIVANGPKAQVILNRSAISGNSVGLGAVGGGVIFSYGNNSLNFNASNTATVTGVGLN